MRIITSDELAELGVGNRGGTIRDDLEALVRVERLLENLATREPVAGDKGGQKFLIESAIASLAMIRFLRLGVESQIERKH